LIRTAETGKAGTKNEFGEEQLTLDVLADNLIFAKLKDSGVIANASSEEQAEAVDLGGIGFSAAFDPLDGSSLVDVNLAVGTIFGIWPGKELLGQTGAAQAAAGYAVYGPRTTFVLATNNEVNEFTLQGNGVWQLTTAKLQITAGKMFAPGNLRAITDHPGYRKLVEYWQTEKYTLRYSGGMVPDVNQILLKGKGVFSYPGSESAPAKLRLLYECAPLAKVIETAGGASSDGSESILQAKIEAFDQRIAVCLGSKNEVQRFEEFCG
jgi:sedoheptulose-bisphosphatase